MNNIFVNQKLEIIFLSGYIFLTSILMNVWRVTGVENIIIWILSLIFGWFMFIIYRLIFLFLKSDSEDKIRLVEVMSNPEKREKFLRGWMAETFEEGSVVYSSVMYFLVLVIAFYVQFSATNMLAKGITVGLVGNYIFQQFVYYGENHHLKGWFWQLRAELPSFFYSFWLVFQVILFMVLTYLSLR